jgi:hypothetical protein
MGVQLGTHVRHEYIVKLVSHDCVASLLRQLAHRVPVWPAPHVQHSSVTREFRV